MNAQTDPPEPLPIGGWLVLPAIGLVLGPILGVVQLAFYWSARGLLESSLGQALFLALIGLDVLMIGFAIYVARLFFRKARTTRFQMPLLLAANAIASVIASIAVTRVLRSEDDPVAVIKAWVSAGIWIPYFIWSSRVKRTFTVDLGTPRVPRRIHWKPVITFSLFAGYSGLLIGLAEQQRMQTRYDNWIMGQGSYLDAYESPRYRPGPGDGIGVGVGVLFAGLIWGTMYSWVLTYPHVGWRRVALVGASCAAIITFVAVGLAMEDVGPAAGAAAFILVYGPFLFLIGRNVFRWVRQGFEAKQS